MLEFVYNFCKALITVNPLCSEVSQVAVGIAGMPLLAR